jgi:hypothetical protein
MLGILCAERAKFNAKFGEKLIPYFQQVAGEVRQADLDSAILRGQCASPTAARMAVHSSSQAPRELQAWEFVESPARKILTELLNP